MSDTLAMAMTLHQLHCARKGQGHECVGKCTITREGVTLDCHLCGPGTDDPFRSEVYLKLERIMKAAGIRLDMLTFEAIQAAYQELDRK
jgi:hypothetical protein